MRDYVPSLKIEGQLQCGSKNETNKLIIIKATFYGETDAFLSFIEENSKDTLYERNIIEPDANGLFVSQFAEEKRYIGFIFPFVPFEKTRRSRCIFLKSDESNLLYRIFVHGKNAEVYSTDINVAKSLYDQSDMKNKALKEELELEDTGQRIDFYLAIEWEPTDDIVISDVVRAEDLDKVNLVVKRNCS